MRSSKTRVPADTDVAATTASVPRAGASDEVGGAPDGLKTAVAVSAAAEVGVIAAVGLRVGVPVGANVNVAEGMRVRVAVAVGMGVAVGLDLGVALGVYVIVWVGVAAGLGVLVAVAVAVLPRTAESGCACSAIPTNGVVVRVLSRDGAADGSAGVDVNPRTAVGDAEIAVAGAELAVEHPARNVSTT